MSRLARALALAAVGSLGLACDDGADSPGLYRRQLAAGAFRLLPFRSFRGPDGRGWVAAIADPTDGRGPLALVREDGGVICRMDEPILDAFIYAFEEDGVLLPLRIGVTNGSEFFFVDERCTRTGLGLLDVVSAQHVVLDGHLAVAILVAGGTLYTARPWASEPPRVIAEGVGGFFLADRPDLIGSGVGRAEVGDPGRSDVWALANGRVARIDLASGEVLRELGREPRRFAAYGADGVEIEDADGIAWYPSAEGGPTVVEEGACRARGTPMAGDGYHVVAPCREGRLVHVRGTERTVVAEQVGDHWRALGCDGEVWTYYERNEAGAARYFGRPPGRDEVEILAGRIAVLRTDSGRCVAQTSDGRIGTVDAAMAFTPMVEDVTVRHDLEAGGGSMLVLHGQTDDEARLSVLDPATGSLETLAEDVRAPIQNVGADFGVTGAAYVRDWDETVGGGTLEARLFERRGAAHQSVDSFTLGAPVDAFTLTIGFHLYGVIYSVSSGAEQGLWLAAE